MPVATLGVAAMSARSSEFNPEALFLGTVVLDLQLVGMSAATLTGVRA